MIGFLNSRSAVYIFENSDAQRVKIGMIYGGLNQVVDRLITVNDMWRGRKVTCQICAGRLLNIMGRVPHHVISGRDCLGGNQLPLEKDVALAEYYRETMKNRIGQLSGSEKISNIRIVKSYGT